MRDPQERLHDILTAINPIERYAAQGRQAFEQEELIQNGFVRHLQLIGEAVRRLPHDIRDRAPDVPWSKIVGRRHILVHEYFAIDTAMVWTVVKHDLPPLKQAIQTLLAGLNADPGPPE